MTVATLRTAPAKPSPAELVARARVIADDVRDRAQETEKARRVSDEIAGRIQDAGLFRVLQPAARGGWEYGIDTLAAIAATFGRACGSTAWVYSVVSTHPWFVAAMPKEAQDEFWADPDARAAGSYPPVGQVVAASGGVRITGSWAFASGCDNVGWYVLGGLVPPADGASPPRATFMLVPRKDVRIDDTWHTMGLAGTGSKNLVADDVFVPAHRMLAFADMASGTGPGTQINTGAFYRQSFLSVLPVALIGPILGMAEGARDDFVEAVKVRTTRGAAAGGSRRMAEFATVQSRVAEATASIDAARLLLFRDIADVRAVAERGEPTPLDLRLRNRLDHAFATKLLLQAVDTLFNASGGQGLHLDKPIQRVWRDAHAAASHASLNWDAVSTMYGQHALGLTPMGQY